ncbi:hypothetical protein GCM10023196_049730 [Actinoallomurus vinaceus]|uniref:Uncharacterized protein n=1 Tax=Actinoallomurus vinaceus TaxID=1080074 RepID=A0ABP8UD23_9ACTN
MPQTPPTRLWRRVAAQLRDPLIVVLLVAAVLTAATGDWTDMAVIVLVIVVNTSVGVGQEVRADRAITALAELTAPTARVVRDGTQRSVPAAEVVVGDLLVLAEGDIVPADARLVEAVALLVDESSLTGEAVPVDKGMGGDGVVSAGTVVVKGRGRALVTAIGAASATGRIASMMGRGGGLTPLQRRLVGIGRMLAGVTVVLCLVVLALGLARGQQVELMVVTAISLVVAAVPESLPAVVTLSLALGARRMAARNALIRRLPAVETLGSVTVLGTDKTGTLTEGRMTARRVWTPTAEAVITGSGYAPDGDVLQDDRRLCPTGGDAVTDLLSAVVLCNDARLSPPETADGEWTALGDPTEAALLVAAAKLGLDREELQARLSRSGERPFDSDRKRMTTVHRLPDGGFRVICKGAPESLLRPPVLADDPALLAEAADRAEAFAQAGFRVLAVAQAERDPAPRADEELERGLRLVGLVAIVDPPRPAAPATIVACRRAGIKPILITGDHPGTARAIATELGIMGAGDRLLDCRPLGESGPAAGDLSEITVFARATPQHKLHIIQTLRERGEIVAMTGDGVNHGLPGVALGGEPAQSGVMTRPPRPPAQSILGGGLWQRVIRIAIVLAAVTLGVAVWAHQSGRPWQSMAFFALGATQLGVALGSRSRLRSWANPMLLAAVASAFVLQLAGLYLPPLREMLGTQPLNGPDLLVVIVLSILGFVAVRLDRKLHPGAPAGDADSSGTARVISPTC